jgi:hypothetical protein
MNGQKQQQKKETIPATPTSVPSSAAVTATKAAAPAPIIQQENSQLKSEVSNLKQRIEAMTKNIDELTSMVQKVTLATCPPDEDGTNDNKKRTKVQEPAKVVDEVFTPDEPGSASNSNAMELDSFPLPPSMPSPMPLVDRTSTSSSELSDEGFVDQLFTAFKTEEFVDFDEGETLPDAPLSSDENVKESNNINGPRPELMDRLSDALSALPREIQELIVDRLIQAITSPKDIQENIAAHVKQADNKKAAEALLQVAPTTDPKQIANLQLAAATLAALLSQCGGESNLKDSHSKALLIPVHA